MFAFTSSNVVVLEVLATNRSAVADKERILVTCKETLVENYLVRVYCNGYSLRTIEAKTPCLVKIDIICLETFVVHNQSRCIFVACTRCG